MREGEAGGCWSPSEQHPPHSPFHLTPHPHFQGHRGRGLPPPLPISPRCQLHGTSETELRTLDFRVFGSTPAPWPRVGKRATPPPPPCYQRAPTNSQHRSAAPFRTACLKPSYKCSVFGFLAQPPPPGLALANAWSPCCLHLTSPHPPPPTITLHCHFTRCA